MKCYINKVTASHNVATDIKLLIPDAGLRRRMSRVIKNAVTAAVECIGGIDNIDSLDGIITATGWGCLADSEKFLRNIIVEKEKLLNPTPFIQSTFNTVGGQIALLRHNHCYNLTYVNRSHSFEDAMLDALMRMADGEGKNLLVGAFDEQTPSQMRIMERMGLFRKITNGEGAVFVHMESEKSDRSIAEISVIDFPQHSLSVDECKERYATEDDTVIMWNEYKKYGLYPTASAQCLADAVDIIKDGAAEVVIYNEYFGATPAVLVIRCI